MASMTSVSQYNNLQLSDPITLLDCTRLDTASAHQKLGEQARAQIHKTLSRQLDVLKNRKAVAGKIWQARKYLEGINSRLQNPALGEVVREAVKLYQTCLSAWAHGAGLADFRHPTLPGRTHGQPVSPQDLATLLQEEETGCQTGVLRVHNGGVILWHTEEDYEQTAGERFDQFRIFSFKAINGCTANGFIYPDLLPGPTFGWQSENYAQAVDSLHVRTVTAENAILPNTLTWLSLYLGTQYPARELARVLGPFQGGYSLTALSKNDQQLHVEKLEFANQQMAVSSLDGTPGSYLFQTNVIRDLSQPLGAEERTSLESRVWNEKRMARTERFMRVIKHAREPQPLVMRMLRSRLGGDSAYANRDVKANMVCQMGVGKTEIWVNRYTA